jgi:hypothetical protein
MTKPVDFNRLEQIIKRSYQRPEWHRRAPETGSVRADGFVVAL